MLQVEHLSREAQDVIHHYTSQAGPVAGRQAALCAATGVLPWRQASVEHFELLASVSSLHPEIFVQVTIFFYVLIALNVHPGS